MAPPSDEFDREVQARCSAQSRVGGDQRYAEADGERADWPALVEDALADSRLRERAADIAEHLRLSR